MDYNWRVTATGKILHAVRRAKGNRTSLCFYTCEVLPYPKYVRERIERHPPKYCKLCRRKLESLAAAAAVQAEKLAKRVKKEVNS